MIQQDIHTEATRSRQQILSQEVKVVRRLTSQDDQAGYYPVHVRSILPAVQMPFSLFLKAVSPEAQEVRYLPFLAGGEPLAADWLTRLHHLGITYLYVQKDDLATGQDFFEAYLEAVEAELHLTANQQVAIAYDHLSLSLMNATNSPALEAHLPQVSRQVDRILRQVEVANLPFHLLWETLLRDFNLYRHATNVFFMAVAFMVYLRHRRADCQAMGMAALFHDVGLLKLPEDIAAKSEPLTAVEQAEFKKHPQAGHDLLRRSHTFPGMALRLVLEHHENADGSGFPGGLEMPRQHPYSRILRMVDAYDLLTSNRPGQPGAKPFEALTAMKNQRGRWGLIFDYDLLNKFIRFIGT